MSKIIGYCTYQERCHKDVRNKLYEMGCTTSDVENNISELIEKNYLNEERFVRTIVSGKMRISKWGRVKIRQKLLEKNISDYLIRKTLKEIDITEYHDIALLLASKKKLQLSQEKNKRNKSEKIFNYLLQKGFESDVIKSVLAEISHDPTN